MPGVVISTALRTGPSVQLTNQASQAFFVGLADRGPVNVAVLCRTLEDFESIFGGYISSSLLQPSVEMFFEEGGTQCYIARVVGTTTTTGTLALHETASTSFTVTNKALASNVATLTTSAAHGLVAGDVVIVANVDATFNGTHTVVASATATTFTFAKTASTVASAAVSTANARVTKGLVSILLTANGPGAYSSTIEAQVIAGTVANTYNVKLFVDDVLVGVTGNCSSRDVGIGKINTHPQMSKYVIASAGSSALVPAVVAALPLSAGDSDHATVVDASYVAGLTLFNDALGTGAVACPESSGATVYDGLLAHANEYSRVAILHGLSSDSISQTKTFAQTIISGDENLEHGALYYPWVYAPTAVAGINRLLPPDGYVAGKRSKVVNTSGAHIPSAGINSQANFITGVLVDIDRANGDALDEQSVNAIRVISNTIRIYGARSLSQDTTNFRYITSQDTVNGIVTDAYRALEPLVFSPIDGRGSVFAGIEARLISVLEGYRVSGALFEAFNVNGQRLDYGYTVKCDATINPASQLAEGKIKAKVGVRVSSVGDKIDVEIVKSSLTASVV